MRAVLGFLCVILCVYVFLIPTTTEYHEFLANWLTYRCKQVKHKIYLSGQNNIFAEGPTIFCNVNLHSSMDPLKKR